MLKQALFLFIAAFSVAAVPASALTGQSQPEVTVKEIPQGYVVSVNALGAPLETLLGTLGDKCRVNITCRGAYHLFNPISIHVKDLPLEQAIKILLKAAGAQNYLVRYSDGDHCHQSIAEVIIFANGSMAGAAFSNPGTDPLTKQHDPGEDLKAPSAPREGYSQKIASFKDRYLWEDDQTREWALYLLEAMPDEAKDFGLDGIIKELDKNCGPERTAPLNAAAFYQAIEAAAPPNVTPLMMQQVRRLSEYYYNSRAHELTHNSRDGF
jgi:hypothetical protein